MADGVPAFLIVGTSRSGTTLVQRLASELPGVVVPPETHFFNNFADGLLSRRSFPLGRADVVDELRRYADLPSCRGLDLDPAAVVDRLGDRCASIYDLFAAIVGTLAGDGATIVGEKTPEHLLWWPALAAHLPSLRFVAVVRDPRAVVASNLEVPFGMRTTAVLAERWRADEVDLRTAAAALGDRWLVLRYENVVADPTAARAELARHLGVVEGAASADATADGSELFHEWETWKAGAAGAVTVERIDAWRSTLPGVEARRVAAVCRRGMAAQGYDEVPGATVAVRALATLAPVDQWRRLHFRWERARRRRRVRRLAD